MKRGPGVKRQASHCRPRLDGSAKDDAEGQCASSLNLILGPLDNVVEIPIGVAKDPGSVHYEKRMADAGESSRGDVMTRGAEVLKYGKSGGRLNRFIIGSDGLEQRRVYCRERGGWVVIHHVGERREFSGIFDVRIHDAGWKLRMEIRELRESLTQ